MEEAFVVAVELLVEREEGELSLSNNVVILGVTLLVGFDFLWRRGETLGVVMRKSTSVYVQIHQAGPVFYPLPPARIWRAHELYVHLLSDPARPFSLLRPIAFRGRLFNDYFFDFGLRHETCVIGRNFFRANSRKGQGFRFRLKLVSGSSG